MCHQLWAFLSNLSHILPVWEFAQNCRAVSLVPRIEVTNHTCVSRGCMFKQDYRRGHCRCYKELLPLIFWINALAAVVGLCGLTVHSPVCLLQTQTTIGNGKRAVVVHEPLGPPVRKSAAGRRHLPPFWKRLSWTLCQMAFPPTSQPLSAQLSVPPPENGVRCVGLLRRTLASDVVCGFVHASATLCTLIRGA
jgi:hypothetical protein